MKKFSLLVFMFVGFFFATSQMKTVQLVGEKSSKVISSSVNWWGYKIIRSEPFSHNGQLKLKNGKFNFKDGKLIDADFIIDMRSLTIDNAAGADKEKWTKDLKSSNFFDVKKHPLALFHISKVLPNDKNDGFNSLVIGEVTIKGKRKTISFPANVNINGYSVSMETAKITINRHEFNVFYKPGIKDYVIKDEMEIQVKLATK
ncbi:YceI family protein [Amniculibacterium sp. G2-70]|uniref:YceI family protein n=1 Tax=Amniculibacterium sp. G2-70 TaxID=2767188 RepID=UPI0016544778|nr:YceI family protein [Amniculibacterium sp. G2-70]